MTKKKVLKKNNRVGITSPQVLSPANTTTDISPRAPTTITNPNAQSVGTKTEVDADAEEIRPSSTPSDSSNKDSTTPPEVEKRRDILVPRITFRNNAVQPAEASSALKSSKSSK